MLSGWPEGSGEKVFAVQPAKIPLQWVTYQGVFYMLFYRGKNKNPNTASEISLVAWGHDFHMYKGKRTKLRHLQANCVRKKQFGFLQLCPLCCLCAISTPALSFLTGLWRHSAHKRWHRPLLAWKSHRIVGQLLATKRKKGCLVLSKGIV